MRHRLARVSDLDLQNPQPCIRIVLEVAEVAATMDRVGKVADAVALDVEVQLPAHGLGLCLGVAVEFEADDLVVFPARLHAVEQRFGRVGAGDRCPGRCRGDVKASPASPS